MRISSHPHRLGTATLLGLVLLVAGTFGAAPAAAGPPSLAAGAAACEGAVVHSVDAAQPGTLPRLCIAVGGVVRVVNTGPGSLLAQPATMVDCFYAAGTYQCRLIRTGTVRLTLAADARELLVRVPAAVPGQPSTACSPAGSVVDLDTTDELRWWSPCLRIGATLRVVDLGPGLLAVTPADAVNCHYEAGIHACQFRRPASVVFTATVDAATRSVTAVAVR
ncbi:hypothetical protein FHR83_003047 [Actinoplanes campanulatus]|uniref:Uncharacterized protein n=1 Tax=Actinoplanes campanulatus TaxID=113559 RepID=A0A7W5AGK5_9ACTN|nr:hypothetical protein [Actinoplanes campanulatus]MBB3095384.1 hypothetical protein [Actinoplanes campanulatus]GGN41814.1 hypothetical protein GCM10010109_72300 [Actinoplanes campanulatus]GID34988.1 hypothetical protein Aca09nite_14940 [Actinoplanes campanulatus]